MTDREKYEALVAEIEHQKEETSIGLNEWENGVEHGRMEVVNALQEKIKFMQGKPASDDLEKEIERWAETFKHNPAAMGYKETARHFAEWQKKQLMAKAVDAQCFGFQGAALFSFRLPADKYLVGSKVKVIVIKED